MIERLKRSLLFRLLVALKCIIGVFITLCFEKQSVTTLIPYPPIMKHIDFDSLDLAQIYIPDNVYSLQRYRIIKKACSSMRLLSSEAVDAQENVSIVIEHIALCRFFSEWGFLGGSLLEVVGGPETARMKRARLVPLSRWKCCVICT